MRLFIALEIPEEARREIARSAAALEKDWGGGRLIPPENYHLTLVFLGEVPEFRTSEVIAAMEACPSPPPVITVGGFGRFRQRGGDILWRQIRGGNTLSSLQRRLCRELTRRGFVLEKREYSPHLTVARKVALRGNELPETGEALFFSVPAMTLFRSRTGPSGAEYMPLRRVAFQTPDEPQKELT